MELLNETLAAAARTAVQGQISASEFDGIVRRAYILAALQEHGGNMCHTADAIGMHRNSLARHVAELNIDVRPIRDAALAAARRKRAMAALRPVAVLSLRTARV